MNLSELNVNNLVRSGVILVAALPLTLGVGSMFNTNATITANESRETKGEKVVNEIKGDLTRACINFAVSKDDSKLERDSKTEIDEYFGGEVNYQAVCQWVSN